MARPIKEGVDYFSHDVHHKKTIFTLETLYGNDGYAFWFKLLELLGSQASLSFRAENSADWMFFAAKMKMTEERAKSIMDTLLKLEAIDRDLWEKEKIIWIQNFADRLVEVYRKRNTEIPKKPVSVAKTPVSVAKTPVIAPKSTQIKLNKIKLNKTKLSKKKKSPKQPNKIQYADFVFMTNDEYTSLMTRLGSEEAVKRCIDILDNYKGSKGAKYDSDYRAILSWVIKRDQQDQEFIANKRHFAKSKKGYDELGDPIAGALDQNPY